VLTEAPVPVPLSAVALEVVLGIEEEEEAVILLAVEAAPAVVALDAAVAKILEAAVADCWW
jgi:hypothetical protein